MCGICGILQGDEGAPDREVLQAMTRTLAPRGPDAEGLHISCSIGLGHRRLKVIDLEGGDQPMGIPDLDIWLIYNGEIYNFRGLADELREAGHPVSGRSDTEVLLWGYLEWGEAVLERLNGMFAFAIWDGRSRRLLLARDRMGQKPLYVARIRNAVLFASELKAILRHPGFDAAVDPDSLRRYLLCEFVPDPHCILQGVRKLEPGERIWIRWPDLQEDRARYWDLTIPPAGSPERIRSSFADAAAELRGRLAAASHRRLVSDVPLGVFLSGGIDSSTVVGLLAGARPDPLRTFCIGFADPSFDEAGFARGVAEHFGTVHREQEFGPEELLATLPEVVGFLDEPFGDASIVPTFLLSRFTRSEVTVALAGDGGDELFAGYPTFQAERAAQPIAWPRHRRTLAVLSAVAARLPVSTANLSFDFKVKQFVKGLAYWGEGRHQVWLGSFSPPEIDGLLTPETRRACTAPDPLDEIRNRVDGAGTQDPWDRLLYFYAKYYLAGDILVKADRAAMAVGLEVRAPFLDPQVVDYACRLPASYRLRAFTTKAICREAARDLLPRSILRRPKKGFGIPVADFLKGPMRQEMRRQLAPARLRAQGIFRPGPIQALIRDHLRGARDARKPLWTLLAFQRWYDHHLEGRSR